MSIRTIQINDILQDDSRFSLRDYLYEAAPDRTCHINSFDTLGILYPVILYEDNNAQLHLIDGMKRLQYAIQSEETRIRAMILPESTPITEIIVLILCNKRHLIASSAINKIQFVYFANSLTAPESWIFQSLCIPFEFKPHSDFFRECDRIYNMPKELKLFCHEKKFSFKQLLNLSYHSRELITRLIQWKSSLHLTASTLDEIASNLKAYLNREQKTIDDFLAEPDVQEIFDSSLSPREKTERLRRTIHMKQFPILSETNGRITKTIEDLHLPGEIRAGWDSTLENKNINLTISIRDPGQWQSLLKSLNSKPLKEAIKSILGEL